MLPKCIEYHPVRYLKGSIMDQEKKLDHKNAMSARTENFEKHLGTGAIY